MQAGNQKPILPRVQRIIELIALVDMIQLAVSHMFLSLLRYIVVPGGNIYNTNYRDIEMYFWLGLMGLAAVYVVLSLFSRATRQRLLTLLRRVLRKETAFAVLFLVWIVISCISRKTVVGDASLESTMNKWILTDTGICMLVLFPLPMLLGARKGKLLIECLFHAVMLFGTVFVTICLVNLFRLQTLKLPSGTTVAIVEDGFFQLGCNINITASIALVMLAISLYMVATQKLALRIVYGAAAVPHLFVMFCTGCRATFGGALILMTGIAFMLGWTASRRLHPAVRTVIALAAGAAAFSIVWFGRYWSRDLFVAVSHYSAGKPKAGNGVRVLSSRLTGRDKIWAAAWKVITEDFRTFAFGTTNAKAITLLKNALGKSKAHAHNQVIQIAMVMGVPAAEAFVVFLCWLASKGLRMGLNLNGRQFRGAYAVPIILLSFLFVNLFEPYLVGYFSIMGCVFFLLSGLMVASHDKHDPSYAQMLRGLWARRRTAVEAKA